mmetsp:Transcript_38935/g.44436  ORF Transcript_38935/g.44436 Transcript_38935/m.44436 type:complete len:88 (+) Transcript_38935:55-318(+)
MNGLVEPGDTIKIDHVFTLSVGDKWDSIIRRSANVWLDVGYHVAQSFRYIAVGIGVYFVLLGCSKLITSSKQSNNNKSDDEYDNKKI